MYGWYSEKQANRYGVAIYKNHLGDEVAVTEVTQENEYTSLWDDVVSTGKVGEFVRRESWGSSGFKSMLNKAFSL